MNNILGEDRAAYVELFSDQFDPIATLHYCDDSTIILTHLEEFFEMGVLDRTTYEKNRRCD